MEDRIKRSNTHVIDVPEGVGKKNGGKAGNSL